MKIIVDTNVLFTFFWKTSIVNSIFLKSAHEFYAPQFAKEEINKYRKEILSKTKLTHTQFEKKFNELPLLVEFIDLQNYELFIEEANSCCPDENDVDFFALSLKEKAPLWSNDKKLKQQDKILVLNTTELISLL